MTVETEVAALTTAVDNLASAVNVSKATLDASVADAQSAQSAASSSATTASGHATSAAASAAAAASTASGIAGFDLDAIAATKAVTAVDVFVYDTSKDSDGGAWRKRTQHTSWYNETLNTTYRGGRREFPAVAVIVAEATKVTIYDGDDPALPMWMVFNTNNGGSNMLYGTAADGGICSSISFLNATLVAGNQEGSSHTAGVCLVNFIQDTGYRFRVSTSVSYSGYYTGTIAQRNRGTQPAWDGTEPYGTIVDDRVNDVAMTVLPDAPIDPATGLPVPTIAVATEGGWSQIGWDGVSTDNVWDCTGQVQAIRNIGFNEANEIFTNRGYSSESAVYDILTSDITYTNDKRRYYPASNTGTDVNAPRILSNSGTGIAIPSKAIGGSGSLSTYTGLTLLHENNDSYRDGMVAYIGNLYNTGWMQGDIKGAFLSSTDTTDLVGSNLRTDTFDDVTDWVKVGSASHTLASVSGEAVLTKDATSSGDDQFEVVLSVTAGQTVRASVDAWRVSGSGAGRLNIYDASGATLAYSGYATTSTHERLTVNTVATTSTIRIRITCGGGANAGQAGFDNLTVDIADFDRSRNSNGLIVNGTVTRSAVATGAELVAYSGFSSSNYLEQPYNSGLDFGTGDFCIMGWVKQNASGVEYFYDRGDGTTDTARIAIAHNSGQITLAVGQSASLSGHTIPDNVWTHLSLVRSNGTASLYVNGVNVYSGSRPLTVSGNYVARFGISQSGATPLTTGAMALWRISATVPTAEQFKKIYEDEKVLFQENAACSLYGTSIVSTVTALAHDSDTGLLHVGTSAGRSVFQGLRRVSNTTTAVGTAISASNGLVVEE